MSNGEQGGDIFAISCELLQSMRERKGGSSDGSIPGDTPVSTVSYDFGRFNRSIRELEFSKFFDSEVVIRRGELSTENRIEIDCFSGDNVSPLRIWELWTSWGVGERSSGCLRVQGINSKELERLDQVDGQCRRFGIL